MSSPIAVPVFQQDGRTDDQRTICDDAAQHLFPGWTLVPLQQQGFCSYTLRLTRSSGREDEERQILLQFRPARFAIDMDIAVAAKQTYHDLCPAMQELGTIPLGGRMGTTTLRLYKMQCLAGVPYSCCQMFTRTLQPAVWERQMRLLHGFAAFVARAWPSGPSFVNWDPRQVTGKVGPCTLSKLSRLSTALPTSALRLYARNVWSKSGLLSRLPAVLNHGDVIPSNILMDQATGELRGLIDWAEAEYLPFGVCLYGLEHLLGFVRSVPSSIAGETKTEFVYYECADKLRDEFYDELKRLVPTLSSDKQVMEAVMIARDVGVLLWHGFAWDDGAIDRVINECDDERELALLCTFLRPEATWRAFL